MKNICFMTDPDDMLKACERGDINKVRQLLEADSTLVNVRGNHQKTPLHSAAEKNFSALAELLIATGADINAEVSWGMTPLQAPGCFPAEHSRASPTIFYVLRRSTRTRSTASNPALYENVCVPFNCPMNFAGIRHSTSSE
jgi:hypothetical protein